MFKKNQRLLLLLFLGITMFSCASTTSYVIDIQVLNGDVVSVETKGMSGDKIAALEAAAKGELNLYQLMRKGYFTKEEMQEIGLFKKPGEIPPLRCPAN